MSKAKQKSTRFATIARIQRTHGKDGEVSVRPTEALRFFVEDPVADDATRCLCTAVLLATPVWLTPPPTENRHLKVQSVRETSDRLLLRFESVSDKTAARDLIGRDMLVERCDVPDDLLALIDQAQAGYTDEGTFGLGFKVHSDNYGYLGTVTEIIETGANLVWAVDGGDYGEVLLPVIDDCILEVDEDAGTALVTVMKGLINED